MSQARFAPSLLFSLLVALLVPSMPALAKAPVFHYVAPDAIHLKAVLGNPPAAGSAAAKADIEAVRGAQAGRTRIQVLRARSETNLSPMAFDTVLGPYFTPAHYPSTFLLLNNASVDAAMISDQAKRLWHRPRPPLQDSAIHPVVPVPESDSFPSGHAMRGALWAVLLVHLDPKARNPLLERGSQIGHDCVIAGVHFPTDVLAGQRLGIRIAHRLLESSTFKRDLARAQAEFPKP